MLMRKVGTVVIVCLTLIAASVTLTQPKVEARPSMESGDETGGAPSVSIVVHEHPQRIIPLCTDDRREVSMMLGDGQPTAPEADLVQDRPTLKCRIGAYGMDSECVWHFCL